jgi:hypothetical protein
MHMSPMALARGKSTFGPSFCWYLFWVLAMHVPHAARVLVLSTTNDALLTVPDLELIHIKGDFTRHHKDGQGRS